MPTVAYEERPNGLSSGLVDKQKESLGLGSVLQIVEGPERENVYKAASLDEINIGNIEDKSPSGPSGPDHVAAPLNNGLDLAATLNKLNKHGSAVREQHPLSSYFSSACPRSTEYS